MRRLSAHERDPPLELPLRQRSCVVAPGMVPGRKEVAMAKQATHPCDRLEPMKPWVADHLYIGDSGQVLCGRCMGTESTYTPWAWSDIGRMAPDRTVTLGPMKLEIAPGHFVLQGPTKARCETDQ